MSTGAVLGAVAQPGACMHLLESTVNCTALLHAGEPLQQVVPTSFTFNAFCGGSLNFVPRSLLDLAP